MAFYLPNSPFFPLQNFPIYGVNGTFRDIRFGDLGRNTDWWMFSLANQLRLKMLACHACVIEWVFTMVGDSSLVIEAKSAKLPN